MENFKFVGWFDENDQLISTAENYSYIIKQSRTLSAKFRKKSVSTQDIFSNQSPEGGVISGIPTTDRLYYGQSFQISAQALTHWKFVSWDNLTDSNSAQTIVISENSQSIEANFAKEEYELNATIGPNQNWGEIKTQNQAIFSSALFTYDQNITLSAEPAPGSRFVQWSTHSNIDLHDGFSESNQSITFNIIGDANISATLEQIEYTLEATIVALDYLGNEISESPGSLFIDNEETSQSTYFYNHESNLTANSLENFKFVGWFDENDQLISTAENYSYIIKQSRTLSAKFRKKSVSTQDIFSNQSPEGGVISGIPTTDRLYYGQSFQISAQALTHWKFVSWDNLTDSNSAQTIVISENSQSIEANFAKEEYELNATIGPNQNWGEIKTQNQAIFSSALFTYDQNITLSAEPAPGSRFVQWSTHSNIDLHDGFSESNQSITFNIIGDANISATLEQIEYTLEATIVALDYLGNEISESPGSLFIDNEETNQSTYFYNHESNLTANSLENFKFVGWFDENDQLISTAENYSYIIKQSRTLSAKFRKKSVSTQDIFSNQSPEGGVISGIPTTDRLYYGQSFQISAQALTHWKFVSWDNLTDSNSAQTIVISENSQSIEANFAKEEYELNATIGPNQNWGEIKTQNQAIFSSALFTYDQNITLSAEPAPGSRFVQWSTHSNIDLHDGFSESNQSITFNIIGDANISATLEQIEYTLEATIVALDYLGNEISESPGSLFIDNEETNQSTYFYNHESNLTANSMENFKFVGWFDENDQLISTAENYSYIIKQSRTLSAKFRKKSVSTQDIFSNQSPEGGVISGIPTTDRLYYGQSFQISAQALTHWKFVSWDNLTDSNSAQTIVISENSQSIEANFAKEEYELNATIGPNQNWGEIKTQNQAIFSSALFTYDQNITLSAEPAPGSRFVQWSTHSNIDLHDEFSESNQSITFNIIGDANISATLEQIEYTLEATIVALDYLGNEISESPGSLFIDNEETNQSTYFYNHESNLTANSMENFKFVGWFDENDQLISTAENYSYIIKQSRTLSAKFRKKSVSTQDIFSNQSPEGGVISGIPTTDRLYYGQSFQISAQALTHWKFVSWDNLTDSNSAQTIVISENSQLIEANFAKEEYELNATIGPNQNWGEIKTQNQAIFSSALFTYDQNITLSAEPAPGSRFVQWSTHSNIDLHDGFSESNQSITFNITGDANISATLEQIEYTLEATIVALDYLGNEISESPGSLFIDNEETSQSTYFYNHESNLTANSMENFKFVGWFDENDQLISTAENYSYIIKQSRTLSAKFRKKSVSTQDIFSNQSPEGGVISGIPTTDRLYYGQSFQISAQALTHWKFVSWDNLTDSNSAQTIVISENSQSIEANFAKEEYELNATIGPNQNWGEIKTQNQAIFSSALFTYDQNITLSAEPAPGKDFVTWSIGENLTILNSDLSEEEISFRLSGDSRITAQFEGELREVNYKIKVINSHDLENVLSEENSSVSISGSIESNASIYRHGDLVSFTFLPKYGYRFKEWVVDNTVPNAQTILSQYIENDLNITAITYRKDFNVSLLSSGGDIFGSDFNNSKINFVLLPFNEEITFEQTPQDDHIFKQWVVRYSNGEILKSTKNQLNLSINQDLQVEAEYDKLIKDASEQAIFDINAVPIQGGSTKGSGIFTVGETVAIEAIPNPGYIFVKWNKLPGNNSNINQDIITKVIVNQKGYFHIQAEFKKIPVDFDVTFSIEGEGEILATGLSLDGTNQEIVIVPDYPETGKFVEDGLINLVATPYTGFEFVSWEGALTENNGNSRPESSFLVRADTSIRAVYRRINEVEPKDKVNTRALGNGWWHNEWFGYYWQETYSNWTYHQNFGWCYIIEEEDFSKWIWISTFNDWFWTKDTIYPHLYNDSLLNEGWFYIYLENTTPDNIIYHEYSTGKTFTK